MVFWGMLFILIDLQISGFDILPDIIGCVIAIIGFHQLGEKSEHFKRGRNILLVLTAFIAVVWLLPNHLIIQTEGNATNWIALLISIAFFVLDLMLVYSLCSGIHDVATRMGRSDLAETAMRRWKYYWVVVLSTFLIMFIALLIPLLGVLLVFAMGVAGIIVSVLLLKTTYDARSLE